MPGHFVFQTIDNLSGILGQGNRQARRQANY